MAINKIKETYSRISVRCYYISRYGPLLFGPAMGEFKFHRDNFYLNGVMYHFCGAKCLSLMLHFILIIKSERRTLYLFTRQSSSIFRQISGKNNGVRDN